MEGGLSWALRVQWLVFQVATVPGPLLLSGIQVSLVRVLPARMGSATENLSPALYRAKFVSAQLPTYLMAISPFSVLQSLGLDY